MKKLIIALLLALPAFASAEVAITAGAHISFEKEIDDEAPLIAVDAEFGNIVAGVEAYQLDDDYDQYTAYAGMAFKSGDAGAQVAIGARKAELDGEDKTEAVIKLTAHYAVLFVDVVAGDGFTDTKAGMRGTINGLVFSAAWRENRVEFYDYTFEFDGEQFKSDVKFDVGGPELTIGYAF